MDDPEQTKQGLRDAYRRLLELDFDVLLLAHGRPLVSGGKQALREFADRRLGHCPPAAEAAGVDAAAARSSRGVADCVRPQLVGLVSSAHLGRGKSSFAHDRLAVWNLELVRMLAGKMGPLPEKFGFGML